MSSLTDLFSKLNDKQQAGVTHYDGPALIVAGAGTGKTTVISARILWLIENKKIKPENILSLTFTEKAATEMEERVDRLLPYGYTNLWIHTFHGFCERILRQFGLHIGLNTDFKLLNETESWVILRQNLDRFNLKYYKPLSNPTKFIYALLKHFSRCKDEGITSAKYLDYVQNLKLNTDTDNLSLAELSQNAASLSNFSTETLSKLQQLDELSRSYHLYQQILLENNFLDFGDLLVYTLQLLQNRPHIAKQIQNQFLYMLVDEFQDTNTIQYNLIKTLALPKNNLMVVGDDDQSIYKFRGASISNILQFKDDYPYAKEIVLTDNYRSGQKILDLAYQSIKNNNPYRLETKLNINKKLFSFDRKQGEIEYLYGQTLEDEINLVIEKIISLKNSSPQISWSDFAVLVRANNAALPFMNAFDKTQIPYQFVSFKGLYLKPIILDCLAYLKILDDFYENNSWFKVLSMPVFNLDYNDLIKITHFAHKQNLNIQEALEKISLITDLQEKTLKIIQQIHNLITKHRRLINQKKGSELLLLFVKESGLLSSLTNAETQENYLQLHYLQQFYNKIKNFEEADPKTNLKNFLNLVKMEWEAGETGQLAPDVGVGTDKIFIMTIHAAKGLEFPFVFLVNLVDKRFPTIQKTEEIEIPSELLPKNSTEKQEHLQEERRLFYVAITRAKEKLFFTLASDYGGQKTKKESIFLKELNDNNKLFTPVKTNVLQSVGKEKPAENSLNIYPTQTKFSFTQLTDFEECPLKYKLKYLLKIPTTTTANLSFGSTIHKTLENFSNLYKEKKGKQQTSLFGNDTSPNSPDELPFAILESLYQKYWISEGFLSKGQEEEFRAKGLKMLHNFHEDLKTYEGTLFIIEHPFTFKIGGYSFSGRIDRIDKLKESYTILDYKTGALKEKLTPADKRQLLLYKLAAQNILGLNISNLIFYFLDANKKTSFTTKEKEIAALETWIKQTIGHINESDFSATAGRHCQYCAYNDICQYKI